MTHGRPGREIYLWFTQTQSFGLWYDSRTTEEFSILVRDKFVGRKKEKKQAPPWATVARHYSVQYNPSIDDRKGVPEWALMVCSCFSSREEVEAGSSHGSSTAKMHKAIM